MHLAKSATWSNDTQYCRPARRRSPWASTGRCSWQISFALRPPFQAKPVVIKDDGNSPYIGPKGHMAQWFAHGLLRCLDRGQTSPNSYPKRPFPARRRGVIWSRDRPMTRPLAAKPDLNIVLCSPRGFCAGVVRAIQTVERALTIYGAPVYVRHEIVHNRYVVDSLKAKGAIFVEELDEIPDIPTRRSSSRPMACRKRSRRRRKRAISSRSTRPARWSPRCTARPRSISSAAARSC